MLRIQSLNINGIRAGARKGFFEWLAGENIDFLCLQETKAQEHQLTDDIFYPPNYHVYFASAEKKGYSGVAIYSKHKPLNVIDSLDWPASDLEGRYIQLDFEKLTIASLYLPSGTSGDVRQNFKYAYLDFFEEKLKTLTESGKHLVICGDWNIAHKQIDIKNWKSNQKNSGFLPEERAWMDKLFGPMQFVDAFRVVNQEADQYTWWSNRGQAWQKNVGWRIDYHVISPSLASLVMAAEIYKDARFSDHAPLTIDYNLSL